MAKYTVGPVQVLARLAIQSKRYQDDMDFRDAVDLVLNVPVYDAAPALLEALECYGAAYRRVMESADKLDSDVWYSVTRAHKISGAAIRAAKGETA